MNKHAPHVYVIPEDDADRQVAVGFVDHVAVKDSRIQVMPVAGGWSGVLKTFIDQYIPRLRQYKDCHVLMLIDFDEDFEDRRETFQNAIPPELAPRVFVLGAADEPESLKRAVKKTFEEIGESLAQDCVAGTTTMWGHDQLKHNDPKRNRMVHTVKPFLF